MSDNLSTKKILLVFGTRPEAIKMVPIIKALKRDKKFDVKVCVTAQHREMLDQVLEIFDILPDYDLNIMNPIQDLFDVTSNVLIGMRTVLSDFKPDVLFIPFPDRHIDHRIVFESSIVASRPKTNFYPNIILSYETLSETHWNVSNIEPNFNPDFFVNIDDTIKEKIKALNCYQSQIKNNQSRSIQAIKALARFRGSQNGCNYAEGFKLIRAII